MQRTIIGLMVLLQSFAVTASENVVSQFIDNPKQVGETSRMTYLFWDVYDASLYAPQGNFSKERPFVLELKYLRALNGKDIAVRSLQEMQKQGFENPTLGQQWLTQMKQIFPDVSKNTRLFGVKTPAGYTQFYQGQELIGEVKDSDFTHWFFNIWLGEKTSEPQMRAELLGLRR
ncbi:chalcone isomerase family protein [Pseudoalteromonas piscicida]|uniref:Chalcone isomerase domain-containing protein n=1 Tax=Pseudoalteromonas piscicida TaxID=43662 RepID=A0A2A5JP26_PSEO7|nr:chalcone isomerase family protein [Pseudoalteromonas piscicida]PCK31203.1 hypothetical protein CEX98_14190 [Pseudoalteromonas piscicida]